MQKKKKKNSEAKLEIQIVVRIKFHTFYDIYNIYYTKGIRVCRYLKRRINGLNEDIYDLLFRCDVATLLFVRTFLILMKLDTY